MPLSLIAALVLTQASDNAVDLNQGLVIGGVVQAGRLPVPVDAVQAALCEGTFIVPQLGGTLMGPDGKAHQWLAASASKDGWIASDDLDGGYFYASYDSPEHKVMLLDAEGDSMVYVNGVPRVGDPYAAGYGKIPVVVERGRNDFLFACSRGRMRASLETPPKAVFFDKTDVTLPDISSADPKPKVLVVSTNPYINEVTEVMIHWGAITVVNATEQPVWGAVFANDASTGPRWGWSHEPQQVTLPPLSVTKIPFIFPVSDFKHRGIRVSFERLQPSSIGHNIVDSIHLDPRAKSLSQVHDDTFLSTIDGSVQYYAVQPAQKPGPTNSLVLSLHGAGVEATGQAQAYAPKDWATIVCPTNRRPYGFDWEDWGRWDAMEALGQAGKKYPHDPQLTVLTGHSMGGHGAWHVSTTFPDRFAAVGPSAGWISFQSYGGGYNPVSPTAAESVLVRALNAGNTLNQVRNLAPLSVYILHGEKDDTVPVSEARTMRDALAAFHHDFTYFEEPGAGHWWSIGEGPGASCVDWAPMFDLFARSRIPKSDEVRDIEFHTASPNVSSRDHWLTILQQAEQFSPTWARIHCDPHQRSFIGDTQNVAALTLDVNGAMGPGDVSVTLDGISLTGLKPVDGHIVLRHGGTWGAGKPISSSEKNPSRGSGFKNALRNFVIVYGTHGSPEENLWMADKARFDAETYWYRANASVPVMSDEDYLVSSVADKYSVLAIGNRDTNAAWRKIEGDTPVDVSPGFVTIGSRSIRGDNLCCLFCRPLGTNRMAAFVGVTGLKGMRVAERLPYFVSGIGYPDYTVIGSDALSQGTKAVLDAGYFTNDWRLAGDLP